MRESARKAILQRLNISGSMHYWELFRAETIVTDLKGRTREEVFREMVDPLIEAKLVSKKDGAKVLDLLKKREQKGTTGIGRGVAIPHVKVPGLKNIFAGLGIHRAGVEFKSIDGEPVNLLFLIVRPDEDSEEHLRFLQWISKLGRHPDFRSFAMLAKDTKEILSLFKEMSSI